MTNKIKFCLSLLSLCTFLCCWSPNIVAQTEPTENQSDDDGWDDFDYDKKDDNSSNDNSWDTPANTTPASTTPANDNSSNDSSWDDFDDDSNSNDNSTPANTWDTPANTTPVNTTPANTTPANTWDTPANTTPVNTTPINDNATGGNPLQEFNQGSSTGLLQDSIPNPPVTPTPPVQPSQESYEEGWGEENKPTPTPAPSEQEEEIKIVDMTGGEDQGNKEPLVLDGIYEKVSKNEKQILTYDHLREADILWQKRIWRVLDTKQKINMAFTYPDQSFIEVLLDILDKHPEEAKIFLTDEFTEQISKDELDARLNSVDTIPVIDPETEKETLTIVRNDFDWTSVTKFRLKEDWVFDEESSKMIVRIIAIAPIREVYGDRGEFRGYEAMFWAYYPDFRPFLVKYEAFNPHNDAQRVTWDDMMEMRYFGSYIMKESNIQDRRIVDYATGKDALLESERVKQELFEKEQNLWSY